MATDIDQMPIDGIDDYDQYADQGHDDTADQDFGALQMFDSNASSAPYSSQITGGQAPEAVMDDEVPSSAPSKKSKRDKKSKKKRKGSHLSSDEPVLPPLQEESAVKDDPPDRQHPLAVDALDDAPPSEQPPSSDPARDNALATPGDRADEETIIPSTQTKKKRKLSDSAEAKRRKKRKTRDEDTEVVQGTQQSLHTHDLESAASREEAHEADGADNSQDINEPNSQNSPSAARLGRSGHGRQSRRKKTSKGHIEDLGHMDLDDTQDEHLPIEPAEGQAQAEDTVNIHTADTTAELLAAQLETEPDVHDLAREAWNEHVGSQANVIDTGVEHNGDETGMDLPEQTQYPENGLGVYDVPDSPPRAEEPPSTAKRTRSTRAKKSKPTYFDESPGVEESVRALAELPSPTAATPKPRKRKQPATRTAKAAAPEKLAHSMHGASDEEDDDEPRGRRNRMAGYTQGRFSEQELARIRKAVESFRVENDLEQHTVNEVGSPLAGPIRE
jgi:hypothetical protein